MLFLEVLWMDWSGRKTSSNTKHCRHFRSYYDQICCWRTLHGDLGSLTNKIKGKKHVHHVGLCWTECLHHKEDAGICVWVVKPWRQHAYTLVYGEAWLSIRELSSKFSWKHQMAPSSPTVVPAWCIWKNRDVKNNSKTELINYCKSCFGGKKEKSCCPIIFLKSEHFIASTNCSLESTFTF